MNSFGKVTVALAVLTLSGCELLGGGGPGVNGADAGFTFDAGFVSVRKDTRNVNIADQSDLQTSFELTSGGGTYTPSLSKDARQVVFVKKDGNDTSLYAMPTSGGSPRLLLAPSATVKNFKTPVFSPDGMTVAFTYSDGVGTSIGLINIDGSNFRNLAGGSSLSYAYPSFNPTGTSVLAAAGNVGLPLTQIESINIATGMPTNVTNMLGAEAMSITNRLVMSPDGTKAVFDGQVGSGVTRIFGIDLGTKAVTKLNDYTGEPGTNDSYPCWTDANTVAYSSDSGGNDNVYKVSFSGTGRRLVLPKAVEPWFGPF